MARAVLIFKENMIKAKELADKEAEAIKARVARAARVNELTQAFDTNISTCCARCRRPRPNCRRRLRR
jgi:methyl-accepting chemotaxis protein